VPRCGRALATGAGGLIAALLLVGCGSASGGAVPHPSPTLPCAAKPNGALCIKVFADGATVRDVIAYLSASNSQLAGKTWRLVLDRYACDPGAQPRAQCGPAGIYPGPTRHGVPPASSFCKTNSGETVTAPSGCHDTLAQELASFGDWQGFYLLGEGKPKTFASRVWLCVSEQIRAGGSWRGPAVRLAPTPLRACSSVS
jgi:hypothetical protein